MVYGAKPSIMISSSINNRRAGAVIMVVLGTILMLLAPEVWQGAVLLILGVVLELVGIALEHKAGKSE